MSMIASSTPRACGVFLKLLRPLFCVAFAIAAMAQSSHATCGGGNFCGSDGNFSSKIELSWNDSLDYFEYELYRKVGTSGTCPPTQAGCTGWTEIYQTYNQVATYNDTTAQSGQMYQYWLCFRTGVGGTLICPQTGPAGNRRITAWRAPPPAPTNLTTTDGTETAFLKADWDAVSDFAPSNYTLYRATSPHNCESGGSTLLSGISGTFHNDVSATPGVTYYYSVKRVASNGGGSSTCLTEGSGGWRKMSPPTNVVASATAPLQVTVNWNHPSASGAPSNGVVTYRVYRRQGSSSSVCSSGQQVGTVAGSSPVFTDTAATGLLPGQNYYYAIRSEGQNGTLSDCSNASASAANPQGYSISGSVVRDIGGGLQGASVSIGTANTTTNASGAFSFNGLNNGSYSVTASKSGVIITPSNIPAFISGNNVTGVTFTASCPAGQQFSGSSCVAITYTLSGTVRDSFGQGLSGVTINGGSLGTRTTSGSGAYSYTNVAQGTVFSLSASLSGYTFSPPSLSGTLTGNYTNADFTGTPLPPNPPTGVSATDGTSTSSVTVSWSHSGPAATSFTVLRNGSPIGAVAASPYSDTTATPGVTYDYSVNASNGSGTSAPSTSNSGYRALGQTTGLGASITAPGNASLTWNPTTHAQSYHVWKNNSCGGTADQIVSNPSALFTGLALGTHSFTVKAVGENGQLASGTPCSSAASITFAPATVTVQATIDGLAAPEVEVFLGGTPRGVTNSAGLLQITDLAAGTYVVTAARPHTAFSPVQHQVTLAYGDQTSVAFEASCAPGYEVQEGLCEPIPAAPIEVSVSCVYQLDADSYRAYFGYTNPNGTVSIPVGAEGINRNFFSGAVVDQGQVTEFLAGPRNGAFSVEFDGSDLTWNVEFQGKGLRSVTASAASPACAPITPQAKCISINPLGQIVARFGYVNPNNFEVPFLIPVGEKNRFSPEPEFRGQPTQFISGTIASAFETVLEPTTLSWILDGVAATATLETEVCAPGNNAPTAHAGGPYGGACQGTLTTIPLSGLASFDPDGNPLRYAWSTDCADGTLSDPTAAQPVLTLLRPGLGQAQTCSVSVTVTDGLLSSSANAPVSVAACALDCLGNPNGSAMVDICGVCGGDGTSCLDCSGTPFGMQTVDLCGMCGGTNACLDCSGTPFGGAGPDQCGVCGGDGTSCLGCVETNLSDLLTLLTRDFFTLRDLNARSLRRLGKEAAAAGLKGMARKYVPRKLQEIDFRFSKIQLELYADLPPTVVSCTNNALCVQIDNAPVLERYDVQAAQFLSGTQQAMKRLRRVLGTLTPRDKKRLKRAKKVRAAIKQNLDTVPRIVSSCSL